ncbi:MAG: hypothetical protein GXY37_02785 [Chloroflexi bacterium]|nr:hypothetical protein [Chloroflexota bacterium]
MSDQKPFEANNEEPQESTPLEAPVEEVVEEMACEETSTWYTLFRKVI